jgi:hypothetical protein
LKTIFLLPLNMTTLTKEKLIETIKELPDSFSVEDLFERIILLKKVEIGMEQSRTGQVHSTEEAREKLKRWLLK